jgi:hypothetical protein
MDKSVNQQALDLGTQGAPGTAALMPLLELIMKYMGQAGGQPTPGYTTSQQTGPYQGPVYNPSTGQPTAQPGQTPLKSRMGY